jgi:hypothetical protein
VSALAPQDVDQFGKILGLLASDHDGERAVAARKATEFLIRRDLHWCDVAQQLKHPPMVVERVAPSRSHQMDARRCLQSGKPWKPHEREFLHQMAAQRSRPSAKQQAWLHGLLDRATSAGRAS